MLLNLDTSAENQSIGDQMINIAAEGNKKKKRKQDRDYHRYELVVAYSSI